jgi:hypothetical protein
MEMLFTLTDKRDRYGAIIFLLSWDSGAVECVSGLPEYDPVPPAEDYPGSCRPIPQGLYRIGAPVHEDEATIDDAIGPDWIPLTPLSEIGGRDGLLIHRDWNYLWSPGTAGCIAPLNHANMDLIVRTAVDHEFLRVDYEM